ncbi:hypothetical protein CU102_02840 [Phyllobacterium brassicacearum]|uniref:Uncharacterized protein n=1 Tax=Phyllobacterium brassicacearum TaxID=314235 RepID=A0A2P7BUA9_9HYPH|nr:hypothetical protein CU102_02840 [Phyllobacterium brassicacearum]
MKKALLLILILTVGTAPALADAPDAENAGKSSGGKSSGGKSSDKSSSGKDSAPRGFSKGGPNPPDQSSFNVSRKDAVKGLAAGLDALGDLAPSGPGKAGAKAAGKALGDWADRQQDDPNDRTGRRGDDRGPGGSGRSGGDHK